MELSSDSQAITAYLGYLQAVISRMAENSRNCKTWCVTLASAIIVLAVDKGKSDAILVGLLPVISLGFLDAYYLAFERDFRRTYNDYVATLQKGAFTEAAKTIFDMNVPSGRCERFCAVVKAAKSASVWAFYLFLLVALLTARCLTWEAVGPQ